MTYHFRKTSCRDYPTRVNQAVEQPSLQVEVATEVVLDLFVYFGED